MAISKRRQAFRLAGAVLITGFMGAMVGEVMAQDEPPKPPPGFKPPPGCEPPPGFKPGAPPPPGFKPDPRCMPPGSKTPK